MIKIIGLKLLSALFSVLLYKPFSNVLITQFIIKSFVPLAGTYFNFLI